MPHAELGLYNRVAGGLLSGKESASLGLLWGVWPESGAFRVPDILWGYSDTDPSSARHVGSRGIPRPENMSEPWSDQAAQKLDLRPNSHRGTKHGLVRVLSQVAFFVSPRPFFFKKIGKLRVVTSHDATFGADGCPFKHLRLALGEFSEPSQHAQYNNVLLKPRVLRSRGRPRPGS